VSKGRPKFAFEAESWTRCIDRTINLTKVFRQKDQTFINMLNEMRFGRLSQESIKEFQRRSAPLDMSDDIEPTELCVHMMS
jgi:ATP-dependent DNA helicase PIF1